MKNDHSHQVTKRGSDADVSHLSVVSPPSVAAPSLSSCPACMKSWQDQAELNLRIAAALESIAVHISELNSMNAQHVERILELEGIVEYLQNITERGGA